MSGLIARKKGRSFVILFNVSCWSSLVTFVTLFGLGAGKSISIELGILAVVLSPLAGIIPACVVKPTERILEEVRSQMYGRESKRLQGQGIIGGKDNRAPVIRNTIPFTNRPLEYRHKIELISATLAIILVICCAYVCFKQGLPDGLIIPGSMYFVLVLFGVIIRLGLGNPSWEFVASLGVLFLVYLMLFYSSTKIVFMCLAYKDFSRRQFRLMIVLLLSSIVIPVLTVILFLIGFKLEVISL
ncbi:MAG: hypothetical protein ACFFCW_38390 [Candidatus Hodarchaeota archaeon]